MHILVKYPTRQRPDQFERTLAQYLGLSSDPSKMTIQVITDASDRTMVGRVQGVTTHTGSGKINAINYGTPSEGWDILLLASDDMVPQVKGYDQAIRDAMSEHYPDTDGALWIHDGRQDAICTIVCMGRAYYDRFGYVYHPSYKSLWCDNEWTEVAQSLGKITKLPELIRNESPDWGGVQKKDRLYLKNNSYFNLDKRNFYRRQAKGFPV